MNHRVYGISVASVYPLYIAKAEKKGRTKAEVDQILCWLTGHTQQTLENVMANGTNLETFFASAPQLNPARSLITGVICGVRVENIEEPTMREIRYMDKLIDELAKGKAMEKILRAQLPPELTPRRHLGDRTHGAQTDGQRRHRRR